jgi:putative transposase
VVAGERSRPDIARRRAQWTKYHGRIDPERLVFIDETWTSTDMAALRGWAPRGQRLAAKVPHGRWKTMTFLAALRHDRIEAPWFIEGPIDGESFRTYFERVLRPTLPHGDIVVMDNLGSHEISPAESCDTSSQGISTMGAVMPRYAYGARVQGRSAVI